MTATDVAGPSITPDIGELLRRPRTAVVVFCLYAVVAWLLATFRYGPRRWFFLDDWWVLGGRDGGSVHSVFQPHNEHLIAVGVVVYRVMFNLFGLNYTPFLVVVVTMHVALVGVVRAVLRHIGVAPWTATITAGALLLFGPGEENIVWSFQLSWLAAMLFSLLQLLVADRPVPIGRVTRTRRIGRLDVLGAALGVLAICSSSIAAFGVLTTAVVVLVHRGYRAAVFHAAPAGLVYLTWLAVVGQDSPAPPGSPSLRIRLRWAYEGLLAPFRDLTPRPVLGVALAALAATGVIIGVRSDGRAWLRRHVLALTMLAMSPLMFAVISETRWRFSVELGESPRYVYVAAVLVIPAIAVAIDALGRRARVSHVVALAAVTAGIPSNIRAMDHPPFGTAVFAGERATILGLAHHPLLDVPPPTARISSGTFSSPFLTVGFLRDTRDRGLAPDEVDLAGNTRLSNSLALRLGVAHTADPERVDDDRCPTHDGPVDLDLREGDELRIQSTVYAVVIEDGSVVSNLVGYQPVAEHDLVVTVFVPSVSVRFVGAAQGRPFRACFPE